MPSTADNSDTLSHPVMTAPQEQQLPHATTKSPSPPVTTCRRLSYDSAQTRSRTRASSSPASRACSTSQLAHTTLDGATLQRTRQPHSPTAAHNHNHNSPSRLPVSTPPTKAPMTDTSPSSPPTSVPTDGMGEGATLKRSAASTPEFVPYSSLSCSPSPAATAAAVVVGAASAAPSKSVCMPETDATHAISEPRHDASPFSCVLTNQTRTSGATEQGSNGVTSGEKSAGVPPSPISSPPATQVLTHAAQNEGDGVRPREVKKAAAAATMLCAAHATTAAAAAAACTPPQKEQRKRQQKYKQQQQRQHLTPSPASPTHHVSALPSPPSSQQQQQQQQQRRSHSANSSGLRRATYAQPAPSLSTGLTGPSPFAAEQLAMPRRPSPTAASRTAVAENLASPPPPPPRVQLARPSGLYRHHHNPTPSHNAAAVASTSMAASQLPGAAAACSRLQLPQKSRLVRTASSKAAAAAAGDDRARRRTPSATRTATATAAAPSSPCVRRSFSASSGTRRPARSATAAAMPPPHQRTPSGTFAFYTTRGGDASRHAGNIRGDVAAGGAAIEEASSVLSGSSSPQKATRPLTRNAAAAPTTTTAGALRSNSAPALRRATSRTTAVTAGEAGTAVPTAIRALPNVSRRLHNYNDTSSASSTITVTTAAALLPSPPSGATTAIAASCDRTAHSRTTSATRVVNSSPKSSRAPSSTATTTRAAAAASHEPSRLSDRCATRVAVVSGALTRRAAVGAGARPAISTTGSGGAAAVKTQRTRPVVSISKKTAAGSPARPSGAATRRVRAGRPATSRTTLVRHDNNHSGNNNNNTVSAAASSMITMEESKEFLQEFQRMNQRELALFGTLLATVANERQQCQQKQGEDQPSTATTHHATIESSVGDELQGTQAEKGADAASIVVQSAAEVSVWTCRRPSLEQPEHGVAPLRPPPAHADLSMQPEVTTTQPTDAEATAEVVVLVRRSCSRVSPSKTPSPSRRLDLDSHEKAPPSPRSPSPTPSAPTNHGKSRAEESRESHHRLNGEAAGSDVDSNGSPSSLTSPPPRSENVPGAFTHTHVNASPASTAKPYAIKKGTTGAGVGGLQPRNANDANMKAVAVVVGGAEGRRGNSTVGPLSHKHPISRKSDVAMLTKNASSAGGAAVDGKSVGNAARQRPSMSMHSSRSRRRQRRRCGGGVGGDDGNDARGDNVRCAATSEPRQRSVTSYTDMRSYSRSEGRLDENNRQSFYHSLGNADFVMREYSPEDGEGYANADTDAAAVVKEAPPPPLAALRRAKELAAEQAVALAQRQRERQQQQQFMRESGELDTDALASNASPSMFSSCGSPSGSSMGRPSSALNCGGGGGGTVVAGEVAEVRMSAAQLQLLIDGSRSRQNWERYQQL